MGFARFAALGLLVTACSSKPKSPEAQVRAQIAKWEEAAEAHDVSALRDGISEAYSDSQGNDRRHRDVHVLSRITSISFPRKGRARVHVAAGLAAREVSDPSELQGAHAAVYMITLDLEDEDGGDWKVRDASWAPGGIGDFVE